MSKQGQGRTDHAASLPKLSEGIVQRFSRRPMPVESLYQKLLARDPTAARWLLHATEEAAPADSTDKQRYALVALGLYQMLSEQELTNRLVATYGKSFRQTGQTVGAESEE